MTLLMISWRSIWRNRRRTIISISAIALGLSLALISLAMGDGIYENMIENAVLQQSGHFTLESPEYRDAPAIDLVVPHASKLRADLEHVPGVTNTKLLILGQGIAKTGSSATGVAIFGVEPERERARSPLAKSLVAGEYLAANDRRKVVIGAKMAERLELAVGKKLVLSSTNTEGDLTENLVRVKGIFRIGSGDADGHLAQVPIGFARDFFGIGDDAATQIGVVVASADIRDRVMNAYLATSPPQDAVVLPWEQVLPELANYVRLDRGSNRVFMGIVIFLCLFTIFNTILMSVLERTREFAVMMAIGTRPGRVRWQVLCESALLGGLGVLVGIAIGGAIAGYYQIFGLDMASVVGDEMDVSGFAFDTMVHPRLSWGLVSSLGGVVLAATLLSSLYALRRIKQIELATVLR